jgi:glycosyltransferase involved in cell wall biosynthesis
MQVIKALRQAGHKVTVSMSLTTHIAKTYAGKVVPHLTEQELWCCNHSEEPEYVLNRLQPDIAVYCNVNQFRTVKRFAKEIIHILDLYGPLQFEGLLIDAHDPEIAVLDGGKLEHRCRELVEKLRFADYLITVSERQKYFWAAYCSLAGFSFADLDVLVCPVSFEVPAVTRHTAPGLTVVYSGGFYPWQNPEHALRAAAGLLQQVDGAKLHIFGGPHAGLPNEAAVLRLLDELRQFPCVEYHGYRPVEELAACLSSAWCALELMERNIERELAITGRTVEFLSTGTPVIYNDYSTLSAAIRKYGAGWTVSPAHPEALGPIFEELVRCGPELVNRLSANARRLALEEFSPESSMDALLKLCDGAIQKRVSTLSDRMYARRPAKPGLRALAVSQDRFAILELRVNNPLRSLHRQGFVRSFDSSGVSLGRIVESPDEYDVVLIQRTLPEYIYLALVDLGIPFALDVDDNVLARAGYRPGSVAESALLAGLRHASVLITPHPRLVRLLEKYSKLPLAQKAFISPNALPYPADLHPRSKPAQIIWIQSDIAAMTNSRQDVVRAVEDFSRTHGLPVVLIGRNVLERPQFTNQTVMGEIDFCANLQFLEFTATSIGVAPLETVDDQETLDFVAGKSDLKMLLFDGYGHPGVYSDAPPYTDSPLRSGGRVIGNSYAEWTEALEHQLQEGWQLAIEASHDIREARHIDRVARESWLPALEGARSSKPFSGTRLSAAVRAFQQKSAGGTAEVGGDMRPGYVLNNGLYSGLRQQIAEIHNSYSWKVTAPLRTLAKPLMERNGR